MTSWPKHKDYPSGYKILSRRLPGEPTFTIRAKDNKSILALKELQRFYGNLDDIVKWFDDWRRANPDKCKDPD